MQERRELARDLRADRRIKLVERRLLEAFLREPPLDGVRKRIHAIRGNEGDYAAAEARAGEPGT